MVASAYLTGLATGLGLIVAIGAQNAFVLRQGLANAYVLPVVLACAISDALLIVIGVMAFGKVAALLPWLDPVMRWGGALFLFVYGAASLRSALRSSETLQAAPARSAGLGRTLAACLALTWLNPHVYLDTVVLLGTISTRFAGAEMVFAAGAVTGSFLFFFSLGYGASLLRPVFERPTAWRALETLIGVTMWVIAINLVREI